MLEKMNVQGLIRPKHINYIALEGSIIITAARLSNMKLALDYEKLCTSRPLQQLAIRLNKMALNFS